MAMRIVAPGGAHSATPDLGDPGLRVCIRPRNLDFWEYEGTRAQLEAEGVIPPGLKWPKALRTNIGMSVASATGCAAAARKA